MNIPLIEQYKRIQARYSALVELDQAIENCFEKDRELNFLPPKVNNGKSPFFESNNKIIKIWQ